jgi:hypothetical protein
MTEETKNETNTTVPTDTTVPADTHTTDLPKAEDETKEEPKKD